MKELKFLLFSDFHYKKMMYPANVSDLNFVLDAAHDFGADFVVHGGDFCNNYGGSPELVNAYHNNAYGLAVFGCYGNHDLESKDNSMQRVTPLLSNRQSDLVYGTADGKIGDGSIGYYYTDISGYRFIFLDTNYSLTPSGEYEHNKTASWGKAKENTCADSIGDVQLDWLKKVLLDAAESGIPCITVSHATFSGVGRSSADADAVRAIFKQANDRKQGTVVMAINGHYHLLKEAVIDGVKYFGCPATLNGIWKPDKFYPYAEADENAPRYIFTFEDYDEEGNLLGAYPMPYSKLSMGSQSLFYEKPSYALISISSDGEPKITVSGMNFAYGITL